MNRYLFLIVFFFIQIAPASGDVDPCRYFKYCGPSSSHHAAQSVPSSSAAAGLNPANISSVKGFGVETTYFPHNPLNFDLVSGDGKMGALISPNSENNFFGNRAIEIDDLFYLRWMNKTQYRNKKLNLSLGIKLIDQQHFGIDLGVSVKRNSDIKKLNLGGGLSMHLGPLHAGAYSYRDDVKINLLNYINPYTQMMYATTYHASTYQENFGVDTYTAGMKVQNLSLDVGVIKTRYAFYNENTRVYLYSSSYAYKKLLFNLALRKEYSPNLELVNGAMVIKRKKKNLYYGLECLINRNLVVGLQHNNFLLNEWSSTLTLFF